MNKKEKRKPKYGLFSCVAYMYKLMWKYERSLALTGILTIPVSVIVSALALYTPSIVLRYLEKEENFSTITLVILGLMLAELISSLANVVIEQKTDVSEHYMVCRLSYMLNLNMYNRDWYLEYDEEVKEMNERAIQAVGNNRTDGVHFPMKFADIAATIIKFFLFGAVVSVLNPLILIILAAGCIVNYWMRSWVRNYAYQTRDIRNGIMKKIDYLALKVAKDFRFGKEIRLYNFKDYLLLLVQKLLGDFKTERKKVERKLDIEAFSNFLVIGIRDSFAYGLLITKAVHGEIDAAQFVLYFSAITAISEFMAKTLELWAGVSEGALQVSDFRESLEIKGRMNHGTGISLPKAPFSIEFKNVTYRYPKGDKKILDHVSFFIKPGEKVALVGMNGTGKTTMTWLMCGLLLPDAGEVYVDGHLVNEYNRDELYTLFGMIPQNYNLLPLSIARNICVH